MNSQEIRNLTCDNIEEKAAGQTSGTGLEETFRNVMLQEIAAHLADISFALCEIVELQRLARQ